MKIMEEAPKHDLHKLEIFFEQNEEFYIYGTGEIKPKLLHWLEENGKKIKGIIMSDKSTSDNWNGIEVINKEDVDYQVESIKQ